MASAWPPLLEQESVAVGRPMSVQEWLELDEDESGELVDGHWVEEEVPDAVHELSVSWLIHVIGAWLGSRGFVFGSALKVLVSETAGRKPDLVILLPGTRPPPRHGPLVEPPDILIEVVSPSPRDERRDRVQKMSEYAKLGVRYYWLVDPALGTFEMFERAPAGYTQVVAVTGGRIESVPGCDGLVIDVDALWTELGRLRDG
ncbi:MAG TPA: Uma2 family endonuclease [Polyangiaceae bacterium]|nr:Uma2 family endonuclease [Polyangiaceae bacterium]